MPCIERSLKLSAGAALWLAASACSGSNDPTPTVFSPLGPDGQELPATAVSCTDDPRVDTYSASLSKPGELGVLSFHFSEIEPSPPAKGTNTFHLQISDANGDPVTGDLGVDLLMPDHGHGTSVTPAVTLDPTTHEYTVTPLYLFMAGVWRIQFDAYAGAQSGSAPLDRAVVFFCIEG
jgi:hypothetical protein